MTSRAFCITLLSKTYKNSCNHSYFKNKSHFLILNKEFLVRYIIAIVDKDLRYAKNLADYINKGSKLPFKAMSYSSYSSYREAAKLYNTEIY